MIWDKSRILQALRKLHREGTNLSYTHLAKSHQPLLSAGLDADDVVMYRAWDKPSVIFDLKQRGQNGEALNSGAIQKDDPGLHAAAIRYFGSYHTALRAAKFNPNQLRERRRWDKAS